MLYCARLAQCIPTYVTWFSDVNKDSLTPLFFSSFRIFVNRCCLVYLQPNTKARFFWLHFVVFVFLFHLRFSYSNCFMLAHCFSLSCSNFNFSRLFFLPYLYFMHTKVVQRSIWNTCIAILLFFHYKMSLAAQYKIFNTVRVHVHLW